MKFEKLMASAAGAAAIIVIATAPAALAKKPGPQTNQFSVACGDGTILVTPETLWPPNHKLKTIGITYVETTSDLDTISLTINSITDDQISEDPGMANTPGGCGPQDDDWVLDETHTPVTNTDPNAAATTVQVRAERCGHLGDRHYDINLTCGNADGSPTIIDVPVVVPHHHPKHTH